MFDYVCEQIQLFYDVIMVEQFDELMNMKKEELFSDFKSIGIIFSILLLIIIMFFAIPDAITFLVTIGDETQQIEQKNDDNQQKSDKNNMSEVVNSDSENDVSIEGLSYVDPSEYYNYPTTLCFQSNAEWSDKGEYYELSKQCGMNCYDYITMADFLNANIDDELISNGGNDFYKAEQRVEFSEDEKYIGELKNGTDFYELYDLGNGFASIISNDYGRTLVGSTGGKTILRVRKNALVRERGLDETESAERFLENTKLIYERSALESGFEVAYYPVFDEEGFVIQLEYEATTASLGY